MNVNLKTDTVKVLKNVHLGYCSLGVKGVIGDAYSIFDSKNKEEDPAILKKLIDCSISEKDIIVKSVANTYFLRSFKSFDDKIKVINYIENYFRLMV